MTRSHLILTAKRGKRDQLLAELDQIEVFVAIREQPGFITMSVLVTDDHPDRVLVDGSWASAEHFERWRETPARNALVDSLGHLLAAEPDITVYRVVDSIS